MDPSRRRLLAAFAGMPWIARAANALSLQVPDDKAFSIPLRVPGAGGFLAQYKVEGPIALTAGIRREPLFPGRATDLMAYRTSFGGRDAINPLLIARAGDVLDVTLANRTGEDTTIHWHGLIVDEKNDGSGMTPIRHGESYAYRFPLRNRAGLYWYHPHPHDRTGAQVHLGMGGLLRIDDAEEDALRDALGLEWGRNDVPLLLQDKQVDERNRIRYEMGEDDWIGNRMLVNFTPEPRFDAGRTLHRFRLANGSNARLYLLAFLHEGRALPYSIIGTDGGLVGTPRRVTQAFLAPAQRLDVLVDFARLPPGAEVMLSSLRYEPMDTAGGDAHDAMEHPGAPAMGAPFDILRIHVDGAAAVPVAIPSTLASLPPAPAPRGAARKFRLHAEGPKWFINGYNFHDDMHAVKFAVRRGASEVWWIRNDMKSMPHPMHVHGFQFRVLERRASPKQVRRLAVTPTGLSPQDLGWLDTVLVWPGETVAIAIDFSQPFSGAQRYMFHCHNLEHEDQGMMLVFEVNDRAATSRS